MRELIVMGLGELGQLYAGAALRAGVRVTPVTRAQDPATTLRALSDAVPLLLAVGEADLEVALESLPESRRGSLILLQNELFPSVWQGWTEPPSVMVPWLLKKKGEPLRVARSTPVFGRHAELVEELHGALGLSVERLRDATELDQAIVDKYAFILTVNALGLSDDITLGAWLARDPARVQRLALEAATLGACLVDRPVEAGASVRASTLDTERSRGEVMRGMTALAEMKARGRTARARVERALAHGAPFQLPLPTLREQLARA